MKVFLKNFKKLWKRFTRQNFSNKNLGGFTLIEILIAVGVIAVLTTIVILTLNPSEIRKKGRDAQRLSEAQLINVGVSLFSVLKTNASLGDPTKIYLSLPDNNPDCSSYAFPSSTLPQGWSFACVPLNNLRRTDGTGWIPVDFNSLVSPPFSNLPIDPSNDATQGLYYSYVYNAQKSRWEIDAKMESRAYGSGGTNDVMKNDGGVSPNLYEAGTDLTLSPLKDRPNLGGSTDVTAPAAVTNLAALNPTPNSIDLSWTAPGDDGNNGTAASYDIRYSTSPITDSNWDLATRITGTPSPQIAGTSQSKTVSGFAESTQYYFAMKASDEVPNISSLSNLVTISTTASIQEITVKIPETCKDGDYGGGMSIEYYNKWTIPGSGKARITKVWFWQQDSSFASTEAIEMAIYSGVSAPYNKISEAVTIYGTGAAGWVYGNLSTPILVDLGQTYIFGIGPKITGNNFRIPVDVGADCAGYSPTSGSRVFAQSPAAGGLNDPVPATTFSDHYGILGVSYYPVNLGDTTPPIISGVVAGNLTDNTAMIVWNTNEPANGEVDYGLDAGYGSSTIDASFQTAHFITLSGLARNTTYHYKVFSKDLALNPTASGDFTFTTTNLGPDVTPPIISTIFPAANATLDGTIIIQGTATDDRSVASVEVKVDSGNYSAAAGTLNWTFSLDTRTLTDGAHTIIARATDTTGNTTVYSVNVTVNNTIIAVTSCRPLDQSNVVYVLQNNVSSTGTCFVVAASGITLDLNGKTVTFGTDSGQYRYGVAIPPDYIPATLIYDLTDINGAYFRGADNIIIKNGSIIQGGNASTTENMDLIADEGVNNVEVASITAMYSGIDSQGFILGNGRNYNIHDNVIHANLSQITNRQHAKSAIGLATTGGTLYVRNNTVYGEGQFGIAVSTKRAFPMTAAEVSGNTMRINGLTTNPYQLVVRGFSQKYQGVSLKVFNNRIDTPGNVSNRGAIFDGIDAAGDGTDGMKFYNNYIDTKEHGNPEYGDAGWTHGFRMRDPDYMIPETKFFNNEFYNNTFKTVAFYNSDTDNGDAISIRITLRNGLPVGEQPNVFHDNTIISQTLDSTKVATAIGLEGHASEAGTIFRNNTITSDTNLLRVTWQGGSGVLFDSNTFQKGASATNFHPVSYGNAGTSTDTIFLDSTIGSGVDFTTAEQTWMGDCCSPDNQRGDRAYYVKWTLNLTVNDGGGTPIAGASVTIKDKNNSIVFTGTTDSFGNVSTSLSEYYWRQAPTYPIPPPTVTTYNPYTITVTATGHTDQTQSVTMNTKKSLTIVMP